MEPETSAPSTRGESSPPRIRWGYVWMAWTGVTLLFILQNVVGATAAGVPVDPQWAVAHEILYWGLWAALTPLLLYWARRHRIGRDGGAGPWVAHVALAVVVAPVQTFLTYALHLLGLLALGSVPAEAAGRWLVDQRAAFLVISLTGLWKYAVVVGLYYAYEYRHRFREEERERDRLAARTAALESRLAKARLEALRMQLQPHFLFNTLNSISVLADEEPARAKRMLLQLSELLRTVLETEASRIPLSEEMEIVRKYLDIQRVRYEERLAVEMDVDEAAATALVPSFLLQPLVENAVRHGVERSVEGNRIRIAAERREDRVRIEVENRMSTGGGRTPPERGGAEERRGIGLANTRERLARAYGDAHRLDVVADGDAATHLVRIEIPVGPDPAER